MSPFKKKAKDEISYIKTYICVVHSNQLTQDDIYWLMVLIATNITLLVNYPKSYVLKTSLYVTNTNIWVKNY